MKRKDSAIVIEITAIYWDFLHLLDEQNEIARQGPTQESKMIEFRGDFPQLSIIKPDVVSRKAAMMAGIIIFDEHLAAAKMVREVLRAFPAKYRDKAAGAMLLHQELQRRNNPKTRQKYNHRDCAMLLGLSVPGYKALREKAFNALLKVKEAQHIDCAA